MLSGSVSLLDRKACAALGAAALEYILASLARVAYTESVCTGAVTLMWLVSSFWHISSILPLLPCFFKEDLRFYQFICLVNIRVSTKTLNFSTLFTGVAQNCGEITPLSPLHSHPILLWLWKTLTVCIVGSNKNVRELSGERVRCSTGCGKAY